MTGRMNRTAGAAWLAAAIALASPVTALAQDGQFDLRTSAGRQPAPEPTVVGPSDPDNPSPTPRRAPAPPPVIVLPSTAATATPVVSDQTPPPQTTTATVADSPIRRAQAPTRGEEGTAASPADLPAPTPSVAPQVAAAPPAAQPARSYQPRDLGLVPESTPLGLWLGLAALAGLLCAGAWLAWSRHFRLRERALPAPEIMRPAVPMPAEPLPAANDQPAPVPAMARDEGLALVLEATRMSATLIATTLSYRLAVTNHGAVPLQDVRIDGDMIAAHASRPRENVVGHNAAVLPSLHRIARLAPGESVTLAGDIRLPLVAITPIRSGSAAFFVPLARLRARGTAPTGVTVEGGGTFLVGQEPGGNRKLQPFRLDLGPRNYSQLGQHLLPAA